MTLMWCRVVLALRGVIMEESELAAERRAGSDGHGGPTAGGQERSQSWRPNEELKPAAMKNFHSIRS